MKKTNCLVLELMQLVGDRRGYYISLLGRLPRKDQGAETHTRVRHCPDGASKAQYHGLLDLLRPSSFSRLEMTR
jgi:hypothetical protein